MFFLKWEEAVNKAMDYFQYKNALKPGGGESLFVRSEYQLVKIDLDEIEYIESVEDYLKIHRTEGKPIMTLMTLKAMLEKLPANKFKRIHRSYVVSLSRIKGMVNRKVRLANTELPVSDSYAAELNSWTKK